MRDAAIEKFVQNPGKVPLVVQQQSFYFFYIMNNNEPEKTHKRLFAKKQPTDPASSNTKQIPQTN
ncbi:MAG: hypothetical protein ABI358_09720 [Ginsengibacter sp.]